MSTSKAPAVTLRLMTEHQYAEWHRQMAETFAAEMGPSRGLDPAAALQVALEETAKLLPQGRETEKQLLWTAYHEDEPVGTLWISTEKRYPFIYGIEVREDQRGKGYGRSIMLAAEEECRHRGYEHLELNVFGNNGTAISLYDSLGYAVTSQQMRKTL